MNTIGMSGGGQGCKGTNLYFFFGLFYLFLLQGLKAVCQWFPKFVFGRC